MGPLAWQTSRTFRWKDYELPCAEDLDVQIASRTGLGQLAGIRPGTPRQLLTKRILWPAAVAAQHLAGTGFILRGIGRWLRRYATADTTFLEIGCGSMQLRKYLPPGCVYNAIDLAFSEFQLSRALRARDRRPVNLALASASSIPLPDHSVSLVAATEVLEHIPPIDAALGEIRRVMRPSSKLLVSIPNNHYHKYRVVGENPDHVNKWTYQGFINHMAIHHFRLIHGFRIGYWIPLRRRPFRDLYLPITPRQEYYTSNFLYAFEVVP